MTNSDPKLELFRINKSSAVPTLQSIILDNI